MYVRTLLLSIFPVYVPGYGTKPGRLTALDMQYMYVPIGISVQIEEDWTEKRIELLVP